MERVDLIRTVEQVGCVLIQQGGKHDWYQNPAMSITQPIPRHREINENLARAIIRRLSAEAK